MDLNTLPSNTTDFAMAVSINFGPKLEPLDDPARYSFSSRDFSGNVSGAWKTWYAESHIERLYTRCNELLAKIEIIERLLNNLAANHR